MYKIPVKNILFTNVFLNLQVDSNLKGFKTLFFNIITSFDSNFDLDGENCYSFICLFSLRP